MESERGTPIVIIGNFVTTEHGVSFSWGEAREFHVGEVVYFEDDYKDENTTQEYLAFMVKFKTDDGKIYSANQLYFVTEDEWADIEDYFRAKFST
jgi:hypothetical protein